SAVVCNAKWTDATQPAASLFTSAKHVCGGTSPLTRESADTLMAWAAQYNWNVNWFGVLP
ncbi:unnamed protein product, partial [Rotaria socialis]